jgi:hypothetical protein
VLDMGAWYIDRSRNLSEETKWIKSLIFTINRLDPLNVGLESKKIIELLPEELKLGKNPYAVLSYLRDIGFLDLDNKLGENSILLTNNQLLYWELVFELLFKRFYSKDDTYPVSPLIVILVTLCSIYELSNDENQFYITWDECFKYLFSVKEYSDINDELVLQIINSRNDIYSKGSPLAVLDIWFNALKKIDIFMDIDHKDCLRGNIQYFDFYKLVKYQVKRTKIGKLEISINNRKELYRYYGNDLNGLIEFIPEIDLTDRNFSKLKTVDLYSFIFGLLPKDNFSNDFYEFGYLYGVFYAFRWCPRIALRKILHNNLDFAKRLVEISLSNELEKNENELYLQIAVDFKKLQERKVSKQQFDNHINELVYFEMATLNEKYTHEILDLFENRCAICNEKLPKVMSVIRIKEFSESFDLHETFDIDNGILLCPNHATLFKKGIISFDISGQLQLTSQNKKFEKQWEVLQGQLLEPKFLTIQRRKYLGYHNVYNNKRTEEKK